MSDDATTLHVDVSDGVCTVTITRPEVLNSFNRTMRADFAALWQRLREDTEVRAIVLQAAGDRAFSTGVDVSDLLGASENPFVDEIAPWAEHEDPGRELGPKRNQVWKPVVAAVQGLCAGGAFYWISEADIVICSPEATFFDPHVTYGMVAALEPIQLTYRMHRSDVLRMALLGLHERMSAERALASGLVTEIVAREELRDRARELALLIAAQPPIAVQGTVKAIWQSFDVGRGAAIDTALMYTQVGNPLGRATDRRAVKPQKWGLR